MPCTSKILFLSRGNHSESLSIVEIYPFLKERKNFTTKHYGPIIVWMKDTRKTDGVTVIELLVVTAVLGVLTSLILSVVLFSLKEARQKVSMSELLEISKSLECYSMDHGSYPPLTQGTIPVVQLKKFLEPDYIEHLPVIDPWGNDYLYNSVKSTLFFPTESKTPPSPQSALSEHDYLLICRGKDGMVESSFTSAFPDVPSGIPVDRYDRDIIISQAHFIQLP